MIGHFSRVALLVTLSTLHAFPYAAVADSSAAEKLVVRFSNPVERQPRRVEVVGLPAESLKTLANVKWNSAKWNELLAVYVDRGDLQEENSIAMLGSHRVVGNLLIFEPRFPFATGVRYRAVFEPVRLPGYKGEKKPLSATLALPKPKTAPTVVAQVYPTRNKLPENQLKFYVHFSAPMARGDVYRHIKLLDGAGKEVKWPFLELGEELWNPDCTRFTLFFDPGRIKRGLKPREEVGPALEEGKKYTLVIASSWKDANGNPLKAEFRKAFSVGAPDDVCPEPKTWKFDVPEASSQKPLTVRFPESLDHALLQRMLWVTSPGGTRVAGRTVVSKEETVWQFTPQEPWQAGTYHLVAETTLEDLAGNGIDKPFEVDVVRPIQREVKQETVRLPFEVKRK